jgi:hypothetical protein
MAKNKILIITVVKDESGTITNKGAFRIQEKRKKIIQKA